MEGGLVVHDAPTTGYAAGETVPGPDVVVQGRHRMSMTGRFSR
jgi:hypothetical protein